MNGVRWVSLVLYKVSITAQILHRTKVAGRRLIDHDTQMRHEGKARRENKAEVNYGHEREAAAVPMGFCKSFWTSPATSSDVLLTVIRQS